MSDATGSAEDRERDAVTAGFESGLSAGQVQAENIDMTRLTTEAISLVLGIVALGAGVLLRNPAVRNASLGVLQDPQVHKVVREAGGMVCRAVATSWRLNGGPAAIANSLPR